MFQKYMTLLPISPSLTLPRKERGQNPLPTGEGREGVKLSCILETSIVKETKLKHNYMCAHKSLCAAEHKQVFLGIRLEIN